ncbi:MAG: hypothetical protein ACOCQD_00710 [archaeon]
MGEYRVVAILVHDQPIRVLLNLVEDFEIPIIRPVYEVVKREDKSIFEVTHYEVLEKPTIDFVTSPMNLERNH